jgi:hypothetical protein
MKKTILTTIVALFCMTASAQFSIMSNMKSDSWNLDSITSNLALGYQVNDDLMLGVKKNGESYDFIGRYNIANNVYLSAQTSSEDALDNVTYGVGVSLKLWNDLYIEPNYAIKEEEGSFNVGLSYKL